MGNRAVITTFIDEPVKDLHQIGIYLHWNGGRDSVEAFLLYCKFRGFRTPETDNYGFARLTQVITNWFSGDLSVGVDQCKKLDCDNFDNGVYLIKNWRIVDRQYNSLIEQDEYNTLDFLMEIDEAQPVKDRIGVSKMRELYDSTKLN